ncbi:MAG: alpha/beta hydrolase [Myxococcota bacterium]
MSEPRGVLHDFVEANSLRFHVASLGRGDRLALCLHGFPECWYSWRYQMPLLAEHGYQVWAPDLRGYGESDRPLGLADYGIEVLIEDVAGLIEAAGARSTVLLGHDWGGIIAWFVAMRMPELIDRLVIMNVPHPGNFARGLRSPRQLAKSWYALFFQLPRLPERLLGADGGRRIGKVFERTAVNKARFGPDVQRVYSQNAARPGALTAMVNYYRAMGRGGGGRRQRRLGYPLIEVPTLMLWGEQDVALTVDLTHDTDRFVRDFTLRYLPSASHWVQQDDPDWVNEILAAWLSGRPVPGATRPTTR